MDRNKREDVLKDTTRTLWDRSGIHQTCHKPMLDLQEQRGVITFHSSICGILLVATSIYADLMAHDSPDL